MKKTTLTIVLSVMTAVSFGQITTTKVAPKTDQVDNTPYDSTLNFLGKDVYRYKGQELYLNGKAESLRKYGYDNFVLDYTKDKLTNKSNVYKCCDSYNSKYEDLAGKYFKVLEIIKHPKAEQSEYLYGKKFYLKLQEKESNDIVYYEYDSQFEHSFPFIVVGFFEKQKNLVVGKEFVFADKVLESSNDIQTGKVVTTKTGQKWKCTDLTIEEKYFTLSLVIENSLGEKTTISHESVFGKWSYGRAYTANEANNYTKKFGQENFDRILQGKVKIGMTREMCKLSWGEPKSINETITSGKKSEQWVYSDNYLYFDNGILDSTSTNQQDSVNKTQPIEKQNVIQQVEIPIYKLFPTENYWTFIKLDTRNGKMWQVHFTISDGYEGELILNSRSLVWTEDEEIKGRFTLYPTKNMYNFILLDQINGKTYQVQWNSDINKRFVSRIY